MHFVWRHDIKNNLANISYLLNENHIEESVPTQTWNIKTEGTYKFEGKANRQDLYTEYLLTGKTSYDIHLENRKDAETTVKVYKNVPYGLDKRLLTEKIPALESEDFSVSGLETDDNIYIRYTAPVDCKGTVK